jgi:uncharacterized protein (TIGR02217 family)
MDYVDTPFPERIAFQAKAEAMWQTTLTAVLSGFETTNQAWAQTRHAYDAGLAIRVASDYLLVKAHFHMMRGRAKSFPFTDPIDHQVSQAAGVLQTSGLNWQMFYRYGSGADAYDRKITRPVSGTVRVFRTRAAVTTDVTGSATVTYTTGIVAITGHVGGDTYAWSGDFYVPCRYDIDRLPGVISNKQPGPHGELFVECDSIPIVEVRE